MECSYSFLYRDFLKSDGSDSDSDDDKRVIKSARDKRLSELASCCDEIRVGEESKFSPLCESGERRANLSTLELHTEQDEDQ